MEHLAVVMIYSDSILKKICCKIFLFYKMFVRFDYDASHSLSAADIICYLYEIK